MERAAAMTGRGDEDLMTLLPAIRTEDGKPRYQRAQVVELRRSGFGRGEAITGRAPGCMARGGRATSDSAAGRRGPGRGERRGVPRASRSRRAVLQPVRYLGRRQRGQPRRAPSERESHLAPGA